MELLVLLFVGIWSDRRLPVARIWSMAVWVVIVVLALLALLILSNKINTADPSIEEKILTCGK